MWYVSPHPDICGNCEILIQTPSTLADQLNKTSQTVKKLTEDLQKIQNSIKIIQMSAKRRVRDDTEGCAYISPDGFCSGWTHSRRIYEIEQKEDIIEEKVLRKKVYRDNVKKNPLICSSCPSYTKRTNA